MLINFLHTRYFLKQVLHAERIHSGHSNYLIVRKETKLCSTNIFLLQSRRSNIVAMYVS